MGKRLQWPVNAAMPTSPPLYWNVGMPYRISSVVSGGTTERITARTFCNVLRAGSRTAAKYASTSFGADAFFAGDLRAREAGLPAEAVPPGATSLFRMADRSSAGRREPCLRPFG